MAFKEADKLFFSILTQFYDIDLISLHLSDLVLLWKTESTNIFQLTSKNQMHL